MRHAFAQMAARLLTVTASVQEDNVIVRNRIHCKKSDTRRAALINKAMGVYPGDRRSNCELCVSSYFFHSRETLSSAESDSLVCGQCVIFSRESGLLLDGGLLLDAGLLLP